MIDLLKLFLELTKINSKPFWIDRNHNYLEEYEIDDDYLKHIAFFVSEGKGWHEFTHNEEVISRIYKECYKRRLMRPDIIFTLHSWALYRHGFGNRPKYNVTWSGEYFRD